MLRFARFLLLLPIIPFLTHEADSNKFIALTFDDGPKPYVLLGVGSESGLLDLLDNHGVKATFFVMGWRLGKIPSSACKKVGNSTNCQLAAGEIHRRGHEIENHTFGHGPFGLMRDRYGEEWILKDIDKASAIIQSVTGARPKYVRPPNWTIWQELRKQIESRGYKVMVKPIKGISEPLITQDVDSEDYFCTGTTPSKCPRPSLEDSVLRKIEERERKGVYGHILVFHELPTSIMVLSELIPELKAKGYAFMQLDKYMETVKRRAR